MPTRLQAEGKIALYNKTCNAFFINTSSLYLLIFFTLIISVLLGNLTPELHYIIHKFHILTYMS
jgi:hypothetical protein